MLSWPELEEIARNHTSETDRLLGESLSHEEAGDSGGDDNPGVGGRLAAVFAALAPASGPDFYQEDYEALVEGRLSAYLR